MKKTRKYSKLAKAIKDFLEDEILTEYDVTLKEEYNAGGKQRYDFCFPFLKELVAIEADGIQHKKYIKFFHGCKEGFEESKNKDFCKDFRVSIINGNIIRISADEIDYSDKKKFYEFMREKLKDVMYLFEEGEC